jgi:hypothetical protein
MVAALAAAVGEAVEYEGSNAHRGGGGCCGIFAVRLFLPS